MWNLLITIVTQGYGKALQKLVGLFIYFFSSQSQSSNDGSFTRKKKTTYNSMVVKD